MDRFAAFVTRRARWLLLAWVAVAVLLTLLAPSLQKVATQDAAAFLPKDVPSEVAERASRDAFPNDPVRDAAIIVFERDRGALTAADRTFIRAQTAFLRSPEQSDSVGVVQSAATHPDLAPFLRAADGQAELLTVSFRQTSFSPTTVEAIARIRDHLAADRPAGLSTHVTGFAGLAADQVSAIETSFQQTAVITVVLVLLILLLIYRSPVAALVPLVTIGVAFLVSRAVVALIADGGLSVSGQAETFMVVMVFGAGTDYCLFLVSRYRELRGRQDTAGPNALQRTIGLVGPVVAASGATVIVGFGSQAAAKSGLYKTMGPAIAIAIAITVLASLTLTPALLRLLGRHAFWPQGNASVGQPEASPRWQRRAARVAAQPLVLLIAGTILLQIPAAGLGWFKQSFDLVAELPGSADAKVGYGALARHYPPGVVSPVFVIVSADHSLLSDPSIKAIDTLTARLAATAGVAQVRSVSLPAAVPLTQESLPALLGKPPAKPGHPSGAPAVALGLDPNKVDVTPLYTALAAPGGMHLTGSLLRQYPQITNRLGYLLSADRHTTRLVISLAHNPYDNSSLDTFRALNGVVTDTLDGGPLTGARVYVAGPSAFYADIRTTQNHDFRSIVAILLAGIFLVLALLLRSLLAPLYLLATVLLSFAATLGITVAVFQGLLGNAGLSFYLPPLLFVVLVALGADYNIFIVGRIREEIAHGLSVHDATQVGLAATGNVITSAGLVMAGTFAGLMLSPLANLRQIGFAVSIGVLIDTFIVRTMLVPSLIMLTDRYAFWPSGLRAAGIPIRRWHGVTAAAALLLFFGGLLTIASGGREPAPRTRITAAAEQTTRLSEPSSKPSPAPAPTATVSPRPGIRPGAPTATATTRATTTPAAGATSSTRPGPSATAAAAGPTRVSPPASGDWSYHIEGTRKIGTAGSTQPYSEDRTTTVSQDGGTATSPVMRLDTPSSAGTDTEQRRYDQAAVRLTYLKQQQGGIAFQGNVTPAADLIRSPATPGSTWTQDFTIGNTHGHRTSKITGTRTITVSGKAYRCTVVESTTDFTGSAKGHETDTSCWSAELGMTLYDQRHQTGTYNAVPFDITSTATLRSRPS
jgi:uncharacterized membrane protein YdfJ with MMPL/SSD domain